MNPLPAPPASTPRRGWHRSLAPVAILVLALLAAACGGGDSESSPTVTEPPGAGGSAGGGTAEIAMKDIAFVPASITVTAGTTVTWTNEDGFDHTVKSEDGTFAESDNLGEGETFSVTFDEPGTYAIGCGIHPSMAGTVVVT